MKNKGERLLEKAALRKNNWLRIQIAGYLLCCFLFGILMLLFSNTNSIRHAEIQKAYGSWEYGVFTDSEDVKTLLYKNALLQEVGEVRLCGRFRMEENHRTGLVGAMDETACALCGARLIAGRMPQEAGEIAVEEGFFREEEGYRIGDTISLWYVEPNQADAGQGHSIEVTICGVLDAHFSDEDVNRTFPTVFVAEEMVGELGENGCFLLLQTRDGYDLWESRVQLMRAAVKTSAKGSCWFTNKRLESAYKQMEDATCMTRLLPAAEFVLFFLLAFVYVFSDRKRRTALWEAGLSEKEINGIYLREAMRAWLFSFAVGVLPGSILGDVALRLYAGYHHFGISIYYPWLSIVLLGAAGVTAVLAGTVLSCRQSGRAKKIKVSYGKFLVGRSIRSTWTMRRLWRHKKTVLAFFVSELVLCVLLAMGVRTLVNACRHLYAWETNRSYDFVLGYPIGQAGLTGEEPQVTDALLDEIAGLDGVEGMEVLYWTDEVEILDEEVRKGEYYQVMEALYGAQASTSWPLFVARDEEKSHGKKLVHTGESSYLQGELGIYLPVDRYQTAKNFSDGQASQTENLFYQNEERERMEGREFLIRLGDKELHMCICEFMDARKNNCRLYVLFPYTLYGNLQDLSSCTQRRFGTIGIFADSRCKNKLAEVAAACQIPLYDLATDYLEQLAVYREEALRSAAYLVLLAFLQIGLGKNFIKRYRLYRQHMAELLWQIGGF